MRFCQRFANVKKYIGEGPGEVPQYGNLNGVFLLRNRSLSLWRRPCAQKCTACARHMPGTCPGMHGPGRARGACTGVLGRSRAGTGVTGVLGRERACTDVNGRERWHVGACTGVFRRACMHGRAGASMHARGALGRACMHGHAGDPPGPSPIPRRGHLS